MNQPIFILIISCALAQAYPKLEIPQTRASIAAKSRYNTAVNGLNTKVSTGTSAVTQALLNKTLTSVPTLKAGMDYCKLNIGTSKTQSSSVTSALNMGSTAASCDTIKDALMVSTGVLNTTIGHLVKLNEVSVTTFQTSVAETVADIYTVSTSCKAAVKAPSVLATVLTDATYDLISQILNDLATTMNGLTLTYTQTLLVPAVVACTDYGSNGLSSNLSKMIISNNDIMDSSMVAAKSALTPYITALSSVLTTVQTAITGPFGEIQQQALTIEQMCMVTTTTTTTVSLKIFS